MAQQEVNLGINVGQAAGDLDKTAGAAEKLEGALGNVAAGAADATKATAILGRAAVAAGDDFSGLVKMLNEFLQRRSAQSGQPVRLFSDADAELLGVIRSEFQGLVKDTKSLPNGIGAQLKKSGQASVTSPEQIKGGLIERDAQKMRQMLDRVLSSVLGRAQNQTGQPLTGLTTHELDGRSGGGGGAPPVPPGGPRQPPADGPPGSRRTGVSQAARHLAGQALAGTGGGVGEAIGAAGSGAARGVGGLLPGGLLGGGLLGLAGYGLFKAASGASEGVDRAKAEAIELDTFKRKLGDVGISFETLRDNLRAASEGVGLTFEQSRKLAATFAETADMRDRDSESLSQETRAAAEFARATGISGDAIARFFGEMRAGGATGDVQDSRRLSLSIADAIKKSGSSVNADRMLASIASYTAQIKDATLGPANAEAFAGMLSSLIGGGLKAGTAAGLVNKFDASFRGGGNGEAADAFIFQALDGNRLGAGRTMALRQAGMFASEQSVFNDPNSPMSGMYGKMAGASSETNVSKVMKSLESQFFKNGDPGSREVGIASLANAFFGGNHAHAAAFYQNYQKNGEGGLNATRDMMDRFKIDPSRVNGQGISTLSEIANAKGLSELEDVRRGMLKRDDLKGDGKKAREARDELEKGFGEQSPEKLRSLLASMAAKLDQESTPGKDLVDATISVENSVQRLVTGLIPVSVDARNLLSDLVRKMAPDSPALKALDEKRAKDQAAITRKAAESGEGLLGSDLSDLNAMYDKRAGKARTVREAKTDAILRTGNLKTTDWVDEVLETERARYRQLGSKAVPSKQALALPAGVMEKMRTEVDAEGKGSASAPTSSSPWSGQGAGKMAGSDGQGEAYQFFRDKGWSHEQASGLVANLVAESSSKVDPGISGDGGKAYGIAQWHPDRQADFEKQYGKSIKGSTRAEQLEFMHYELTQGKESYAGKMLKNARTAGEAGAAVSTHFERPADKVGAAAHRGFLAEQIAARAPVQVPAGNPQQATESAGRRAFDSAMGPTMNISGQFTLADPRGALIANPVVISGKVGKPKGSGATGSY